MSSWDIFHSDRLTVERGLSTAQVRAGLASGAIREDDLARPAGGVDPWTRLPDLPALTGTGPGADGGEAIDPGAAAGGAEIDLDPERRLSTGVDNPVPLDGVRYAESDDLGPFDPEDEDDEAAEFTLARGSSETIEELDLAAMVDVAFQLVLFFLVTATTVLYKSLEVPKPNPEQQQEAASQGKKSASDLQNEYILVKIDAAGSIQVDSEPVKPDALLEKLRKAREDTGRKSMLLTADFNTMHRNAVLAYDVANEIGLGIAIARPAEPPPGSAPPAGAAPAPPAAAKAG